MTGKPCIKGTRITVESILQLLASGASYSEIIADFPSLNAVKIRSALSYAAHNLMPAPGFTAGLLKGHKIDDRYTDEESLQSVILERHPEANHRASMLKEMGALLLSALDEQTGQIGNYNNMRWTVPALIFGTVLATGALLWAII